MKATRKTDKKLKVYKCDFCPNWHLGHKKKEETMSGKRSRELREKFENESGFEKDDRNKASYKDLYKKYKRKAIGVQEKTNKSKKSSN